MTDEKKKDKPKKEKPKNNTMKMTLINYNGQTIIADGTVTDKEIKAICKALSHSDGQKITIT
ncbi:hypothetical protein KAR91_15865 [Candidatus Pacearchaeota archaeon]|nr:hypothetical protein [Candidatus Pacearchaeota archaeon]